MVFVEGENRMEKKHAVSVKWTVSEWWKSWHLYWTAWPLDMGPMGCPETSVTNNQLTMRNIPGKRRSHRVTVYFKRGRHTVMRRIKTFRTTTDRIY